MIKVYCYRDTAYLFDKGKWYEVNAFAEACDDSSILYADIYVDDEIAKSVTVTRQEFVDHFYTEAQLRKLKLKKIECKS